MKTKIKPDWAGEDLLSQLVNVLIQTPPIYRLMKRQARQVLIKTAEKNGISWRKRYQQLETSEVKNILSDLTNPNIIYPDYYQKPFHAYDAGNLCWDAAFEAESATYAMGLRVWRDEKITWETAQDKLRSSFHHVLKDYLPKSVNRVLDIGCSVGISTRALHQYLKQNSNPHLQTIGLDLSPYMLAVAQHQDTQAEIQWKHALAENTGFPDDSFDVVTLQFVIHELPHQATCNIFQEILRILRPGGCLALVDNNPKSPVIQNLPPVLFTLMKSTEPWSDDYYTFDVEAALKGTGFEYQTTVASDPRHRTMIAIKPD